MKIPNLTQVGIHAQRVVPHAFSRTFTRRVCKSLGLTRKKSALRSFAKKYKIDFSQTRKCHRTRSLEACLNKFTTLDSLFARKILPELTAPASTLKRDIVSPAECYVRKAAAGTTFDIKGAHYTVEKLLDTTDVPAKSTVFIFRLAPHNYHRIHSPTSAKIVDIRDKGGHYQSVDPILLDRRPVLQENYRKILRFDNGIFMAIVGATCVGSIHLTVGKGDTVHHGQDMGAFGFGGSCIALVIPGRLTKVDKSITTNERPFQCGHYVCTMA